MPNRTHPHEVPTSRPPSRFFSVVVREGHLDTLGCKSRFPDLAPPFTGVGAFLSLPHPPPHPRPICLWRYPRETVVLAGGPSMDALRLRREPGARPQGRSEVPAKLLSYILPGSAAAVVL